MNSDHGHMVQLLSLSFSWHAARHKILALDTTDASYSSKLLGLIVGLST